MPISSEMEIFFFKRNSIFRVKGLFKFIWRGRLFNGNYKKMIIVTKVFYFLKRYQVIVVSVHLENLFSKIFFFQIWIWYFEKFYFCFNCFLRKGLNNFSNTWKTNSTICSTKKLKNLIRTFLRFSISSIFLKRTISFWVFKGLSFQPWKSPI